MKTRIALSVLTVASLTGCAVHPVAVSAPQTIPLTQASLWLNHSAAVAANNLKHLDQITEVHLQNPAVSVTHVSRVSGLTDRLHLHWSGPVNRLMAQLAQRIGWRDALVYHPYPMPDVAIWDANAPLPLIVHEINHQMVHVATLRMLPLSRTLELTRYNPNWLPEHPVLSSGVTTSPVMKKSVPIVKTVPSVATMKSVPVMKLAVEKSDANLLTVGKNGTLHPLKTGPHGPVIPLKKALSHHWKLLMPAHPTMAENVIGEKWIAAGGYLMWPHTR